MSPGTSAEDSESEEMTVGRLLAERLGAAGVRRVFGVPGGGSNLDLIEDLEDVGVNWVLCHIETGAALMACATAEVTGTLGVVVVGNGPGLASVVNGVAHAALDRTPLLVISDRYTDIEASTSGHQILDQRALLAPLVKFSATINRENASQVIDEAIQTAFVPPAGPVHLDMARDAPRQLALTSADAPVRAGARPAESSELGALSDSLGRAERPVMLVGLESSRGVEASDLQMLASRIGASVLTTYKAKGAYPEEDAHWAGILTGGEIERPVLDGADLLLAIGVDSVELLAKPWSFRAPVVSLAETDRTDAYLRPRIRVVGPVADSVPRLLDLVPDRNGSPRAAATSIREVRESMLESLRIGADEPLPSWRVMETLSAELPSQTTIAVDAGAHMFPATMFLRPTGPRRFLISNGLATMGFAVPAAIAAALARPDELAVAITGDGGIAYHLSELETAVRCGARVIVVVLNDSSFSLIRVKQEAKGYVRSPLYFAPTRFDDIAAGLGLAGVRVTDVAEFRTAAREALAAPTCTVIDAQISGREYRRMVEVIRGSDVRSQGTLVTPE